MTGREKEVIEIIKKYPEEILEVVLDLLKKKYKIATKRDKKILYYKITQLENNTKLEIEKIRAEVEKSKTETQYHTAKSEGRIIKFILASSIIQTIFIISAVLTIIFKAKPFFRVE
jgi:phenylalanyl-tRNA synthetase alpha subunit